MMYARWLGASLLDLLLLPVWYLGAPILSAFTRAAGDGYDLTWGGWFGTYDNPPQGDRQWVEDKSPFPGVVTGWRGYVNRVGWLWRNPGYGFQKAVSVPYTPRLNTQGHLGKISDKYGLPGWYFVTADDGGGFAFYCVYPYPFWPSRCLRVRLGYKMRTDKFKLLGFAPLVNTISPFKSYGGA